MFINGTEEMGSSIQQYCLRWNNHRSNLLLVFEHLFQTEAFTDVTLACDGESIKCHKMVLAACSSYFQQLLMENTCRHPIVILKDIREPEIRAILEYMYKGEVNVAQDQLAGLLKAAETLKVKGLVEDNNQRTAPSTPAPTPPHQSASPYHPPTIQQPLQPPTTSSSSQHLQEQPHFYSSSSASGNHAGVPNTTSYNSSNSACSNATPNNGNGKSSTATALLTSSSKFNSNDSYEASSPYCAGTTSGTPPERILNALPFPVWPNKLNLSPKNGNGNGNGSSSIVTANSNNSSGGNVSVNVNSSSSFESGLLLPNDQPVPLKKKRFMTAAASSPSSSVIANKDTPILRTVLGHTGGGSSSHALNSIDQPHKVLHYPYTTSAVTSAPITTNGPVDNSEQLRLERERERERERDRDRERDQDSPVDLFMDDSARSVDSDRAHDDNHSFGMECDDKKGGLALYVPSQKPEWKRYKQYTRNDIMAAIDAVRAGMSALQAARKFGVPSRTLYDKVKKLGITTNRPYRKGSFPMSPYQGLSMKDDNSSYSPEELPLDISSTGNGHLSLSLCPEGDSDKVDSDPGGSSAKQRNSPPLDYKEDFGGDPHPENGSENCSSASPRDQLEPEDMRSHSE